MKQNDNIINNSYSNPAPTNLTLGRYNAMNQAERDYIDKNNLPKSTGVVDKTMDAIKNIAPWLIAPALTTYVLSKLKKTVEHSMKFAENNLLINMLRQCYLKFKKFGADAKEREMWFLHMLTLATAESNLRAQAHNKTKVKYEGKWVNSEVYGLLQQTQTNWNDSVRIMSPFVSVLSTVPIVQYVATKLNISVNHMLRPMGDYGPTVPDVYQVTPNMGAMLRLKNAIDEDYHYYKGQWIALPQEISASKLWYGITQDPKYKNILKDYYLGRQLIITLIHTNGRYYYQKSKLYHDVRLQSDPVILNQLLNEDTKWSFLAIGDITDPKAPKITSHFKRKSGAYHGGYDLQAKKGASIYAVNDGLVTHAGWEDWKDKKKGFGRYVEIKHPDGKLTRYGHLDSFNVKRNTYVKSGDKIGEADNSGHIESGNSHLHYEILVKGKRVDPAMYVGTLYDYKRTVSPFYILINNPESPDSSSVDTKAIKV